MKISLSWIKEYVDIPWGIEELSERLTGAGLEVESVQDQAEVFRGFVVGHVTGCEKHPKADRLSVCMVDVGKETLQIVCGAPNVAQGQKVIVGLVGATVPHNQHDPEGNPFVLGKVKLRGVESNGMICSETELGLGDDGDGIMVLPEDAAVGRPVAEVLGMDDVVFDIAITPNRADCLSHIGIARDIAALTGGDLRLPDIEVDESGTDAAASASIEINDPDLCPRYSGRVLSGVTIGESPEWMKKRLRAVGMRPLNVVVDVTNYVMLEMGQPLHAFDLEKVHGSRIIVRRAGNDATFTTLDDKERKLSKDTLMICDAERPVAVAGVMGGLNSEISDTTTHVLIESAHFHPSSIRRTARSFGLSTEASYRFERGVDPELPVRAADRAASLMASLAGATVHNGVLDAYPGRQERPSISLRVKRTNEILGTNISAESMETYLKRLGCEVSAGGDGIFAVTAPTFRMDIDQEIDLVEEVARVHGYDNIETMTKAAIDFSVRASSQTTRDVVRNALIGFGYNEIMTLSLQKEAVAGLTTPTPIRVLNPVSAEMQALRASLIPEALEAVRSNMHRSRRTLRLFEVGNVFSVREGGTSSRRDDIEEEQRVLIVQTGVRLPDAFDRPAENVDILELKGDVESLLKRLRLDKYRFIPYDARKTLTEQALSIEINGESVGLLGKVRQEIAKKFDIDAPVYLCDMAISPVAEGLQAIRQYEPLPRYPSVQRDLAFIVGMETTYASLEEAIRQEAGPSCESISLFDTYTGDQVGAGKKSLAFALVFRSPDGTLKDSQVDAVVRKIVDRVARDHDAQLRS